MITEKSLEMSHIPDTKLVEVTCIFIKISQIDTVREMYTADISIQAKWREPLLDGGKENIDITKLWNPLLYVENILSDYKESVTLEVVYSNECGFILEKRRIHSVFREILELQQFPFDCQDLSVKVSTTLPIEQINLIESTVDISRLNIASVLESQEWDLYKHVEVLFEGVLSDISLGPRRRQRMSFICRAKRKYGYFLINHFMISSLLCFMAFCSFGIVVSNTFSRLQLCMVDLLTNVAFKVALSQNLPKISYLTCLDKTLLVNLCTIALLCLWHSGTSVCFNSIVSDTSNSTNKKSAEIIRQLQLVEQILIPVSLGVYTFGLVIYGIIIYFDAGKRRRVMTLKDRQFQERLKILYS